MFFSATIAVRTPPLQWVANTTSINTSNGGSNYDSTSDNHNIIIGSIALLLAAGTIILAIVLYRLERFRGQRSFDSRLEAQVNSQPDDTVGSVRLSGLEGGHIEQRPIDTWSRRTTF
ncbi:uncharacterized protein LTR77_009734 [Saxophila tyrrhenica]|uniref:Uncharacterized protein n=1 Tax=Saxophila tyrrhenica TaxID=1690608 RepID=A0AAV9P0Z4_9PEZI|nr:hypothetical protein LTR77_009734 [Saxophila tyrrhenica]